VAGRNGPGDGLHPQCKTRRLTDRQVGRRVLRGKWVFMVKDGLDKVGNNTTRYKARLRFIGNRQIKGLDFNETCAPVAKFTTFRCILAMTAANEAKLHQMDVKTAFLNCNIDEKVYMEQPERYVDPTYPHKVCRLLQALYGLKQAPKTWYPKLDAFVKSQGFDNIDPDACLHLQMNDSEIIIVLVYVDDLLLVGSSMETIKKIKKALRKRSEMKDLGDAKVILGIEISRDKTLGTLKLSQGKYAAQML